MYVTELAYYGESRSYYWSGTDLTYTYGSLEFGLTIASLYTTARGNTVFLVGFTCDDSTSASLSLSFESSANAVLAKPSTSSWYFAGTALAGVVSSVALVLQ